MTEAEIEELVDRRIEMALATLKRNNKLPTITISKEAQDAMQKATDAAVVAAIKEIPAITLQVVEGAVAKLLGVRSCGGGKYEVDGFNSILRDMVERTSTVEAAAMIQPIVDEVIKIAANNKTFIKSMAASITHTFNYTLKRDLEDSARKYCDQQIKYVFGEVDRIDMSKVLPHNVDLASPFSFETRVGELILEELAKRIANGEALPDKIK
jgi:hypothetical protein